MNLSCDICDKPRHHLVKIVSPLIPAISYLACNDCVSLDREPRYIIKLAYMQGDDDQRDLARKYIIDRKYSGEEIKLSEVL